MLSSSVSSLEIKLLLESFNLSSSGIFLVFNLDPLFLSSFPLKKESSSFSFSPLFSFLILVFMLLVVTFFCSLFNLSLSFTISFSCVFSLSFTNKSFNFDFLFFCYNLLLIFFNLSKLSS